MGIKNQFLIISLIITVYNVLIIPIEYYLTNIALVVYTIQPHINILIIILMIFLANMFNSAKLNLRRNRYIVAILLLGFINIIFFKFSHKKNLFSLDDPLIYEYFPRKGYQAEIIKIKGKNYFPTWQKGKVLINNKELNVISWTENLIIAEQPVLGEFGVFGLEVVRGDGKRSNKVYYKVENPSFLPK